MFTVRRQLWRSAARASSSLGGTTVGAACAMAPEGSPLRAAVAYARAQPRVVALAMALLVCAFLLISVSPRAHSNEPPSAPAPQQPTPPVAHAAARAIPLPVNAVVESDVRDAADDKQWMQYDANSLPFEADDEDELEGAVEGDAAVEAHAGAATGGKPKPTTAVAPQPGRKVSRGKWRVRKPHAALAGNVDVRLLMGRPRNVIVVSAPQGSVVESAADLTNELAQGPAVAPGAAGEAAPAAAGAPPPADAHVSDGSGDTPTLGKLARANPLAHGESDDALKRFGARKDTRISLLDDTSGRSVYEDSGYRYETVIVRRGMRLLFPYNGFGFGGSAWARENAKNTFTERARLKVVEDILDQTTGEVVVGAGETLNPKEAGVVIDVGSMTGTYGLYAATYGFRTYFIEPNPLCVNDISKAVVANSLAFRTSIVQAVAADINAAPASSEYAIDVGLVCRNEHLSTPYTARLVTNDEWLSQKKVAEETVKRRLKVIEGGDTTLMAEYEKLLFLAARMKAGGDKQVGAGAAPQPDPFQLSDMRVTLPVAAVRLDTFLASKEITRVRLLTIDVGGSEPGVILPLLGPIRDGIIENMVVRFLLSSWPQYGFADRGAVASFIAEMCKAGQYYVVRLPATTFKEPVAETIANELREGRLGEQEYLFSNEPMHGQATRCT